MDRRNRPALEDCGQRRVMPVVHEGETQRLMSSAVHRIEIDPNLCLMKHLLSEPRLYRIQE
jgi:hypothetical protein